MTSFFLQLHHGWHLSSPFVIKQDEVAGLEYQGSAYFRLKIWAIEWTTPIIPGIAIFMYFVEVVQAFLWFIK